jgi:hypothetical protein
MLPETGMVEALEIAERCARAWRAEVFPAGASR